MLSRVPEPWSPGSYLCAKPAYNFLQGTLQRFTRFLTVSKQVKVSLLVLSRYGIGSQAIE